jgi:hypothetical protein
VLLGLQDPLVQLERLAQWVPLEALVLLVSKEGLEPLVLKDL